MKVEQVPELRAIVKGIIADLKAAHPDIQVIRSGALQIALFRNQDFGHAQIVVGTTGITFIFNTDSLQLTFGPLILEDPNSLKKLYDQVDEWVK